MLGITANAGNYSQSINYCELFRRAAAPHHEHICALGLSKPNSKVAEEQHYTKCKPSINTFSCWELCEMVTFCFLKGIYATAYQVITASALHHSQVHCRQHQYKDTGTMKDDCDNYYVGCSSCLIKQSVSHSFRATWICFQQSCFIPWQDKDYKAVRKEPEMEEPF